MDCSLPGSSIHGIFQDIPGKNTGVGCHFLLQEIFPTQRLNPGLPHCRQILYQLSHQGSPRILEWVAYPFSSRSSQPRNGTGISCIAGGFFTSWAIGKALSTGEDFITTDINLCWIALMFRICAFFCPQDDCIVRAELRRAYWKKDKRNQRIKRPSCPSIKKQRGRHQAQPAQKL